MEITSVRSGSIAQRAGLQAGDRLLRINGHLVRDLVDLLYLTSEERMGIEVESAEGIRRSVVIEKQPGTDLGLTPAPDPVWRCSNRCIFCFVDQLPPNLRPSLYVKDEDYRLSFLHGSYVTLTNLGPGDFERIGSQRLSPLYVSVHATEPDLRARILGNRRAGDIMGPLRKLAGMRITIHAQVVLCPGINNGAHLQRTVEDLLGFYPWVESVAIVPVGLTMHRQGLPPLSPSTPEMARSLITTVEELQKGYRARLGTRGVFLADEFYLIAGVALPTLSDFEGLPQVENGVGMTPRFLEEIRLGLQALSGQDLRRVKAVLLTGSLMEKTLEESLAEPVRAAGGDLRILAVPNRFLGESVTVSGLLSGGDMAESVRDLDPTFEVFLPPNCVNEDGLFLDGGCPEDLRSSLGVEIHVAPDSVREFLKHLSRSNRITGREG